jgi:hypothetical protein
MKNFIVGCLVALGLMSSPASAEIANLTGHYVCVKNCNGMLWHSAYVTQNGWDLNCLPGPTSHSAPRPIGSPRTASGSRRGIPVLCTLRTAGSFSSTMG